MILFKMKTIRTCLIALAAIIALNVQAGGIVTLKNASSALLNVFAYDEQNRLLHSGTAFFVDAAGTAAAPYDLLRGAYRAEVIDFKGKKYEVHRILGANSSTDLVKFSVRTDKGNNFFELASAPAAVGLDLHLLRYTTAKKQSGIAVKVTQEEAYNDYRYYHVSAPNDKEHFGALLVDDEGRLVALVQQNVEKNATEACAIDARFINDLRISSTSFLNKDLRGINIPKALPRDMKEALTYIYMLPSGDTLSSRAAYNDFIEAYPGMADGYVNRANYFIRQYQYALADADFAKAFEVAGADTLGMTKDAVHYQYGNAIYKLNVSPQDSTADAVYPGWTLQKALEETEQAYRLQPQDLYQMQVGHCLFAQQNYEGAYNSYIKVCANPDFASAETYYDAAMALEKTGRDSLQVIALLDSCIAAIPHPVSAGNAVYYWERAKRLIAAARFRDAVFDLNEYEKAVGVKNLGANFYYVRSQVEFDAHMYQQTLDDLHSAIVLSGQNVSYRLEEANILLVLGEFLPAIEKATALLKDVPDMAECYIIIGIAHGELGHKAEARKNLLKAQELGDTTAGKFLQKYN